MTVTATNRKEQFTTNGVTTEFTFTFAITNTSQVYAYTVIDGVETEYTDFTVIASDDVEGGTLTTNSVLSGVDLLIYRDVALTQQVDYESGGRFPADSHEQALDKLTLQNQDQQEELDRTLKSTISNSTPYQIGELEDGKLLTVVGSFIKSTDVGNDDLEAYATEASASALAASESESSASESELTATTKADEALSSANDSLVYSNNSSVSASNSSFYASLAASNANFKGNWIDQVGEASVPSVYLHNSAYWQLLVDVDDISATEPSLSNSDYNLIKKAGEPLNAAIEMPSLTYYSVGDKVEWLGYYSVSDGGSNWGIIKQGSHTADGGSIFTIGGDYYVEANLTSPLNARKFGVKFDGSDDTASFQACATYTSSKFMRMFIPEGDCYLTEQISFSSIINVHGANKAISRIIWGDTASSSGFSVAFDSTGMKRGVDIESIGLFRSGSFGGTAITINGSVGGGYPGIHRGVIKDVLISGLSRTLDLDAWETGIYSINIAGLNLSRVVYRGAHKIVEDDDGYYYGTFYRQDDDDTNAEVSSHYWAGDCQVTYANIGIYGSSSEGLYSHENRMFNVDYGVVFDNAGHDNPTALAPRLTVRGGHISAKIRGVKASYSTAAQITDVYFLYNLTENLYNFKFIELTNSGGGTVLGCLFETLTESVNGVLLNNTTDVELSNNSFSGNGGVAFECVNARYNQLSSNKIRFSWDNFISHDEASYSLVVGGGTTVRKTTSQSIGAATATLVEFDSVYKDVLGNDSIFDSAESSTVINAPIKGNYKINISLILNGLTAGDYLEVDIKINGVNAIGSGKGFYSASGPTLISALESDSLPLASGDDITISVYGVNSFNVAGNSTATLTYLGDFA